MSDAPTPAQADEKALWARYEPEWGCMKLCAKSDFGAVEYRLAALRTEGEAVACTRCQGTGFAYNGMNERMEECPDCEARVTVVSPPAPAGVKASDGVRMVRFRKVDSRPFVIEDEEAQTGSASTPAEALPSQTSGVEARSYPDDATPEMVAAALKVDWSNEDEEGVVHNVWHAMRAAMPKPIAKPASEPAGGGVREALRDLLHHVDRETCVHEETHRGGFIWTICDQCGRKWADDEGGFVPYSDPPAVARARLVCDTPLSSPASSSPAEAEALPAGGNVEQIAKAIVGPHKALPPGASKWSIDDLRAARWNTLSTMEKNAALCSAKAVLALLSSAPAQAGSFVASARLRPEPSEREAFVTLKTQLHHGHPVGTVVYNFTGYDYGCASEDTAKKGMEYRAYTLNKDGSEPFFTHPVNGVEPFAPPLSDSKPALADAPSNGSAPAGEERS